MNRIDKKFNELRQKNKKANITFLMAGDPSLERTKKLIRMQEEIGVDLIEIGIPFSDPLADGPVIQSAANRALKNQINVEKVFQMIEELRETVTVPFLILTYYNIIFNYGVERFIKNAGAAGIDGLIVPDLPYEEEKELTTFLDEELYLIPLVAPTSKDRLERTLKNKKGFVYCVSSTGVTGKQNIKGSMEQYISSIRKQTALPICVGFGIKSPEDVQLIKGVSDGAIVGSSIVSKIEQTQGELSEVKAHIQGLFNL